MAFNILVELKGKKVPWYYINYNLQVLSEEFIEFFPIPNYRDSGANYIGISVLNRNMDVVKIGIIKSIINYLLDAGYKVFELYTQNEFLAANVDKLCDKFFDVK